ncbi:MAG: exodeoxyribonuclease VII small subunit [Erysipelotrichaceae bacterium]|jgi:exodeoxyribonuclease VII small subunit|nr:exodeoxyribonuclease VII small subunit [Erysipelotrichaceae bacterium]
MEEKTFEQAMARLNEITALLENNEVPLQQAIGLFEEGLGLIKSCNLTLSSFESKVTELLKDYEDGSKTL